MFINISTLKNQKRVSFSSFEIYFLIDFGFFHISRSNGHATGLLASTYYFTTY